MTRSGITLAFVLALAACSGSDDNPAGGGVDARMTTNRFLGTWPDCTFSRRLNFTTPSGTPDRAMVNIPGSLVVTDNGNGTIKLTPSATGITNCVLDFTLLSSGSMAQIVPNQTCNDDGLVMTFTVISDVGVSTGDLAASFVESFTGTYMGQAAAGNGGGVYHCTR